MGLTADFRSKPLETVEAHVCLLKRLLERGLVEQDAEKHWHITESGRMVIRRQL